MARTQVGAQTKTAEIQRSSFDLSHGLKTTLNASDLVPILSLEVLPGDTINLRASLFGRMATPQKPVLDNLYLETFFFFTPWRQVWPNFTKLMGEQENPGDSIDYVVPAINADTQTSQSGDLFDYFGIPLGTNFSRNPISALPFRCYNKIYNFWFRDENLMAARNEQTDDGPDGIAGNLYSEVAQRRKRRDYLTSALPFPQKGPDVTVNLGGSARIYNEAGTDGFVTIGTGIGSTDYRVLQKDGASVNVDLGASSPDSGGNAAERLMADLGNATGISINSLRESVQIQKLLERDARGGTRYPEILRSHFQVTDPGLLVHQRPLFLGGGSSQINITPVAQSTQTSDVDSPNLVASPQGNLAAYGTVSANNHGFTASFTEHGHILGLVNVRADLTYQQGLERYWSRQTRYDFYWPTLSHLGEQAIKNREIFITNVAETDADTFGYIPRYDEYRFKQSQITGLFRSAATASLDFWHLAQDFAALPALDEGFITDAVPMDRVLAVPSEPDFLLDVYFKIKAARPLPLYGTPGMMDHF